MPDKTPPKWAASLARTIAWDYCNEEPDSQASDEISQLIAEHAPDAEALAVALESFIDADLCGQHIPKISLWQAQELEKSARAVISEYRARFPKES